MAKVGTTDPGIRAAVNSNLGNRVTAKTVMTIRGPETAEAAIPDSRLERLAIGVEVDARYRLEEIAGTGGMSTVWRARDQRLERTVAIKVMSDSLAADAPSVTRFAREIRVHSEISHPNLVRVFDYSVTAPRPYLVMEYIPGASLAQRLDSGALSGAELTPLACDLLSAIGCVHDHGVLHRDIKPANVLLDGAGRARLTDFGIAHLHDSTRLTHPGNIVGTLRFLAPELVAGGAPTRQSDLFALGVTLSTAGEGRVIDPQLRELIDWLKEPKPRDRPRNAQTALSRLTAPPIPLDPATLQQPTVRFDAATLQQPTVRFDAETLQDPELSLNAAPRRDQRPPLQFRRRLTDRWRQRAAAAAALAGVVLTIGVMVTQSGGGGGVPGSAASTTPTTSHPSKSSSHATKPADATAAAGRPDKRGPTIDSDLNALAAAVKHASH
jgi:serine/threonine protein kinase